MTTDARPGGIPQPRDDAGRSGGPAPGVTLVAAALEGGAPLRVVAVNRATGDRLLAVSVVGVDPRWAPAPVTTGVLAPGAEVELDLPVAPFDDVPPGVYACVVAVQALDPASGAPVGPVAHADAEIRFGHTGALRLGLADEEPTAVHGRRIEVVLDNSGLEPVRVELEAQPSAGLSMRLRRESVTVPANAVVRVPGRVDVPRARLFGQPRRLPFLLTGHGPTGRVAAHGVFVARPLLGPNLARMLAVLLVVLLWAGAAAVGVDRVSDRAREDQASTQLDTVPADPPDEGAEGEDSGEGGGEDSGEDTDEPDVQPARLSGTVTAAVPAGVTVTLRPTSLVDEEAVSARMSTVSATRPIGKVGPRLVGHTTSIVSTARSTVTGKDGAWAFADVHAPGFYLLTFSKPGYQVEKYVVSAPEGGDFEPLAVPMQSGRGRLVGAVTGPDGAVGGAALLITDGTTTVTSSTPTTGSVGSWSVDGLSTPATYLVHASRPGLGGASRLVTLGAGGQAEVTLALRRGVQSLIGTVRQRDPATPEDEKVGGATVTVTDGDLTRTTTTVTTGALMGSYALPDLPVPASYTLTVSGDGYLPQTQRVTLTADTPRPVDALLTRATATVNGRVLSPAGEGLVGAGVVLTGADATYKTMTLSNEPGAFSITGVAPGSYVVSAEQFGRVTDYAAVEVAAGEPSEVVLTLEELEGRGLVPNAHIQGQVVDARNGGVITCDSQVPVGGCIITVSTVDERPDGPHPFTVTTTPGIDYVLPPVADGSRDGLLPGLHEVRVSAPGFEPATVSVQVPAGAMVTAPTVALHRAGVLTGTISTPVGAIPAGTCVIAVPSATAPADAPPCKPLAEPACESVAGAKCTQAGADGTYTIRGLDHGSYRVFVVPGNDEYVAPKPVEVTLGLGETKRYDTAMDRLGRASVTVLQPNDAGTPRVVGAGVAVSAFTSASASTPVRTALTGADGVALLTRLQPGSYVIKANDGTRTAQLPPVPIGLNQSIPVSLVLSDVPAGFRGRVVFKVDGVDRPVAGAKVTITGIVGYDGDVARREVVTVTTDADGCFAVTPDGAPVGSIAGADPCHGAGLPTGKLALVVPRVDISIDATAAGMGTLTLGGVGVSSGTVLPITMRPPGTPVAGSVTISPPPTPAADLSRVSIQVIRSAPGAGSVTVLSDAGGTLRWIDPAQPTEGLAWPGTYRLRASLPGHDDAEVEFTVPLASGPAPPTFTFPTLVLKPYGGLRAVARTVDPADPTAFVPVNGAVFILTGGGLPETTVTAPPGQNSVTFPNLSPAAGPYQVEVRAGGFAFTTETGITLVEGVTTTVEIELARLGAIVGRVTGVSGASGAALPGAVVTAVSGSQSLIAVTDFNGDYRITGTTQVEGLLAGSVWDVTVTSPGYSTGTATGLTIPVAGDVTQNFALTAETVTLHVQVVDDTGAAKPIGGATVRLNSTIAPTSESPAGTYNFVAIVPTRYSLTVVAADHAPLSTTVTLQVGVPDQTVTVVMAVRANSVTGVVSGQRGTADATPLEGATVTVTKGATTVASRTTNASGEYEILDLPDGTYKFLFAKLGYGSYDRNVTVRGGQIATIDATLVAVTHQLTVTVASAAGPTVSMAGAIVTLTAVSGTGAVSQAAQTTGASATTVFNQVAAGSYTLTSTGPTGHLDGSQPLTIAESSTSSTVSSTITVAEQRIRTSVTTSPAQPNTNVTVTITPSAGGAAVRTLTGNADGAELIAYVAVGSYTVRASANNYAPSTQTNVTGNDTLVTLVLTAGGSIRASVTSGGPALSGATVTVTPVSGSYTPPPGTTNGGGDAVFNDLPAGTYNVSATKAGYTTATTASPVTVTAGAQTAVPLAISPLPATLVFTVVDDATGDPVVGAVVTIDLSGPTAALPPQPTGPDGKTTFSSITPGTYDTTVAAAGYAVANGSTTVANGETKDVEVRLVP